ncbi:MAG: Rnf-Nqr domain containing protein, partial [Raoultibacter sp.]
TIIMMVISAYFPELNNALGIYLPLIVVNCIVLGRAEVFASKHPVKDAALDGLGMGVGFTMTLILMSSIREVLGAGTFFDLSVLPPFIEPMLLFGTPPGGFIVLGVLIAASMALQTRRRRLRGKASPEVDCEPQEKCGACGVCAPKGSERS